MNRSQRQWIYFDDQEDHFFLLNRVNFLAKTRQIPSTEAVFWQVITTAANELVFYINMSATSAHLLAALQIALT
jgi:hypothetical protein